MKRQVVFALILLAAVSITTITAAPINAAFGKPVSLSGTFSVGGGYCGSPPSAPGSTLVDALFIPESTCWQTDSVWWDARLEESAQNTVEIDLQGLYELGGFTVQADNNDTYRLEYLDANGQWQIGWDIPAICCYGLRTRSTTLPIPITGSALRFSATGGDLLYSVSEIMVGMPEPGPGPDPDPDPNPQPTPEPSTALLLAGGGVLAASLRRALS